MSIWPKVLLLASVLAGLLMAHLGWAASIDANSGAAYVNAFQISANGPGSVSAVNGYNSAATAQFVMIFDSATCPPTNGTTPYDFQSIPTGTSFAWSLVPAWPFTNGACVAQSSSAPTLTLGTAALFIHAKGQK